MGIVKIVITSLFVVLLFSSCASFSTNSDVENIAITGNYSEALNKIEAKKNDFYGDTDQVLLQLDTGVLAHYAGVYDLSNQLLSKAEQLIFDNYTKSVSQSIGSFLTNDTVIDYPGESYEDIYTNLFMALNYLQLNNIEDAFVEIRRFDNKQKALATKYQADLVQAKSLSADASGSGYSGGNILFHNSALARYLSLILYRSIGQLDSAEIDRKKIEEAFITQKQLYQFPVPKAISDEFSVPNGMARINFFAFSGLAPIKYEETFRDMSSDGSFYYKLAIPVMEKRESSVYTIDVSVISPDGTEVASERLEKIESIENIAIDTFQARQSLIYFKSLARSISKAVSSAALDVAAEIANEKTDTGLLYLLFSTLSLVSKASTEATEKADLRTSRYFPAVASIGGVTVPPGVYSIVTTYRNSNGNVIYEHKTENMHVSSNNVNMVETICLH